MESPTLAARHDFDTLSTVSRIEVRPAKHVEIPDVALMARTMVPGVHIREQDLLQHYFHDDECILMFVQGGRLLGGMAFLYLSERGLEALISAELTPTHPDFGLLARRDEQVAAIYIWALGSTGRGIAGLGKISEFLRRPRYVNANCFAQPSTAAGRELMIATGFRPIASSQADLWCYERPWKRLPAGLAASNFNQGSISNARY